MDVNTVNDNPDFDNDAKNPRGLFNGERGQDQNNDASQGKHCLYLFLISISKSN